MSDPQTTRDLSLSDSIYEALKSRLILGAYMPGDRLSMRKLAAEFGTSAMPVREALKRLASERAIESAAAKAYNVPELSDARSANLFVLRGLLEVAAARAAYPALTPDVVRQLSGLCDRMAAHLKLRDFAAYMTDNHRFHFLIYGHADNQDMLFMIEQLWMQTGPALSRGLQRASAEFENWNTEHVRLVEAIVADDPKRVEAAMHHDIAWGRNFYSA